MSIKKFCLVSFVSNLVATTYSVLIKIKHYLLFIFKYCFKTILINKIYIAKNFEKKLKIYLINIKLKWRLMLSIKTYYLHRT